MKTLNLREKICRTALLTTKGIFSKAEELGGLDAFFEKYPIGGIFVGGEVIKDPEHAAEEVRAVVDKLQAASTVPLFVTGDFEWGVGQNVTGLTQLTSIMGLAAAASTDLARRYGETIAAEGRRIGAHASFSPVADLNVNPFNQITNVRSAGDDPEAVIELLTALVEGMQGAGLSATAKHFPGDGFDFRNQHFVASENPLKMEDWKRLSGRVFQALIDAGLHMIMAGHIALPSYQEERILGLAPPCTLSEELMTRLLKKEMGFSGAVVSDALMMGGFLSWYEDRREAELQCLKAGCDLLLWPLPESLDYMEEAARDGRLSEERLDDAIERIHVLKRFHGIAEDGSEESQKPRSIPEIPADFPAELAEKSLHLERDRTGLLPITGEAGKKVLLTIAASSESNQEALKTMAGLLEQRGLSVDVETKMGVNVLIDRYHEYDLLIFACCTLGFGSIDLAAQPNTKGAVWEALCYGRKKTIVISFGTPYIHEQYFELAPVCINAWSATKEAQEAVVKALFGEIKFTGRRPVQRTANAENTLRKLL
jgi:beta-N-acetylhexosaminidase